MSAHNSSSRRTTRISSAVGAVRTLRRHVRSADFAWARGAGGSGALSALSRLIGLANAILLARLLQPAGYGLYSYAYAIAGALVVPAQFGIPTVVIREIAAGQSLERWGLARGVIRWAHGGVAAISALIFAIAMVVLVFRAAELTTVELITYIGAITLVPVLALDTLRGAVLTGLGRVVLGRLPSDLLRPLIMLGVLLVAGFTAPSVIASPAKAMCWMVMSAILAYMIGGRILLHVRPAALCRAERAYSLGRWSISALPIGFNSGLGVLNQYVGMLILGVFASKVDVGQYRVAVLGSSLVVMGLNAVNSALAPYYAKFAAQGDGASMQRFATRSARLALFMAVLPAAMYVAFGSEVIRMFFGGGYVAAYLPLMVLLVGQMINAATGSVGLILYMSGHETAVSFSVGAAAVVNIAGAFALVPRFGMEGAAVATATSEIVANVICCWYVWKKLGIVSGPVSLRATRSVP